VVGQVGHTAIGGHCRCGRQYYQENVVAHTGMRCERYHRKYVSVILVGDNEAQ
jgi:hypothetical protein